MAPKLPWEVRHMSKLLLKPLSHNGVLKIFWSDPLERYGPNSKYFAQIKPIATWMQVLYMGTKICTVAYMGYVGRIDPKSIW